MLKNCLNSPKKGKLLIILDNEGSHGDPDGYEGQFEKLFKQKATEGSVIKRGKFRAMSHSKVMIQKKNGKAIKYLPVQLIFQQMAST